MSVKTCLVGISTVIFLISLASAANAVCQVLVPGEKWYKHYVSCCDTATGSNWRRRSDRRMFRRPRSCSANGVYARAGATRPLRLKVNKQCVFHCRRTVMRGNTARKIRAIDRVGEIRCGGKATFMKKVWAWGPTAAKTMRARRYSSAWKRQVTAHRCLGVVWRRYEQTLILRQEFKRCKMRRRCAQMSRK